MGTTCYKLIGLDMLYQWDVKPLETISDEKITKNSIIIMSILFLPLGLRNQIIFDKLN
jgi:hypothetical protein